MLRLIFKAPNLLSARKLSICASSKCFSRIPASNFEKRGFGYSRHVYDEKPQIEEEPAPIRFVTIKKIAYVVVITIAAFFLYRMARGYYGEFFVIRKQRGRQDLQKYIRYENRGSF